MSILADRIIKIEEMTSGKDFIFGRHLTNPKKIITWNPAGKEVSNPHMSIMGKFKEI